MAGPQQHATHSSCSADPLRQYRAYLPTDRPPSRINFPKNSVGAPSSPQITDVEIDGVNKPNLPIPAGNLSPKGAKLTVTLCLIAGMVLGLIPSSLGSPGLSVRVKQFFFSQFRWSRYGHPGVNIPRDIIYISTSFLIVTSISPTNTTFFRRASVDSCPQPIARVEIRISFQVR